MSAHKTNGNPAREPVSGVWFKEWFNQDYLLVYPHRDQSEADAQVSSALSMLATLGIEPGGRVLDLGCGTGRHSKALHQAKFEVVGIDLSIDLLKKATLVNPRAVSFARCDIRHLPFRDSSFDLLSCFFTSFGYFATDTEHCATLREWRRVICSSGALFLDLPDRELTLSCLRPRTERNLPNGESVIECRTLSEDGLRLNKTIAIHGARGVRSYQESIRLFHEAEISTLMNEAGYSAVLRVAADKAFEGRMVMVGR